MENFLRWVEKILGFIKKYGFINILKSCIIVIVFSFTMSIAFNPKQTISMVVDTVHSVEQTKHESSEEIRKAINPIIIKILDKAIIDMGCDRAFIMEGHNGKSNSIGLGFYFVDMTYESCKIKDLKEAVYWQYTNMPTSIFPFFDYMDSKRYFYGPVDSLSSIDPKVAQKVYENGTKFIVAVEIPRENSANSFIGILGFSYKGNPPKSQEEIKNYMLDVRRKLRILLSLTSLENVNLDQFK